ncbi:UNVERIFIED_CONTAM: hypothetical protein RMT77_005328 [Armadillidium vulgare]
MKYLCFWVFFIFSRFHFSIHSSAEETILPNGEKEENSPPNIILFLADDLGYGDLGFSGHPTSRTPNIDALAEEGRVFTHFYVTSPVCSPSRSSILTGRYQIRSGTYPGTYIPNSYLGLPHNETTIAKLLKGKGYRTQIIGKWHLGVGAKREYLPSNPVYGFDDYFGVPYSHDMCPCITCFPNNGSCFDNCWGEGYVSCPLFSNSEIVEQPVSLPSLSRRLLGKAAKFVIESGKSEPFFLYYAFHHIHHPQFSSSKFVSKSPRGTTGDSLLELDSAVQTIKELLERMNLLNNTLIWFTSDNGPSLQRHERGGCAGLLRCGKGTTWEGGVRVPSIVSWKNKIAPGLTNDLTSSVDILPTIASIAGIDTSNLVLDGFDISQSLFDKNIKGPRKFYAIYPESPTQELGPFAVVYENYKAHFYTLGSDLSDPNNYDPMCPSKHPLTKHDPPLLFNLYADPGERYNLGLEEEYTNLVALIKEWRDDHMRNITWMSQRTQKANKRAQPCCTNNMCDPFPQCCDCSFKAFTSTIPDANLGNKI